MDFAGLNLRSWAARVPDRLAVRTSEAELSYGELEALANRMAHVLRGLGVQHGDHVAGILDNDPLVFALVWASYRVGAYFTPVPSTASAADAAYVAKDCAAKVVIADVRLANAAEALRLGRGRAAWLAHGGEAEGAQSLAALLDDAPPTPVENESSGALMMYTSGTTGAPKGVWRPLPTSDDGCPAFARDLITIFGIEDGDRYLSTAPLYHAAALRFGLAFTAAGGSVFVMRRFDPSGALDLISRHGITHAQFVPTMFQRLLALDEAQRATFNAPALRVAIHAAAPCPVPVKRAMIAWWGPILREYYSGTEGVGLTELDSHEWLAKPGSVGKARKGRIRILGEDWQELPAGTVGKIYFSDTPLFEYLNAPDKTAGRRSPQGWQTFGDIGFVDADGYLFLTDRQDDMIISGGVNIYPQELESALLEHGGLQDAAVVGLPDPEFGERPVAFLVAKSPSADLSALGQSVDAWCKERLGRVKRPKELRFLDALPRNPQGKILRRELKRSAGAMVD